MTFTKQAVDNMKFLTIIKAFLILTSGFFMSCTKLTTSDLKNVKLSSLSSSDKINNHINMILNQKNLKVSALYNGVNAISLNDKKSSMAQAGGDLTIQSGETVVIDTDLDVGVLTINGTLACSNSYTDNIKIKAATIFVNGVFECGSSDQDRFLEQVTVSLKDSSVTTAARRGLIVNRGGQLKLFGSQKKVNWTRLSETARAGSMSLRLDSPIAQGWEAGDLIAIGPTGYNPAEAETVAIASVADDGRTVQLQQPLQFNHWGTLQSFRGKDGNVSLDQRAEVANLSRNIKIMADESSGIISDENGIGGHVMVMPGGSAYVDAVEFSRMGQAGVMGRYPFHWHMAGDVNGQFIRNSSIRNSFQRCVTVHTTQRALVQNNVCYGYRGHGYFLEEGNEIDNILIGNLAMYGRRPRADKVLLQSDIDASIGEDRASPMSGIWVSHPRNIIRENTVSGTEGTGIWMSFITGDYANSNGHIINNTPIVLDGQQIIARPTLTATTDFSNNISHTNIVGINWDGAPGNVPANNPRNPDDKVIISAYYTPSITPVYSNLTVYKNTRTGIYYRGNTAVFDKNILADNGWNFFVAYNQVLKNSSIIGQSNNLDENDYRYMFIDGRSLGRQPTGMILYDGPAELDNVNFLRFSPEKIVKNIHGTQYDLTPTLFYEIGGANKYMSLFKNLYIEGRPYYKFNRGFRADDEKSNFTRGWYDVRNSTQVRDLDGSLTGRPGAIIVPDDAFIKYPGCISETGYDGYVICDGQKRVTSLYMAVNNSYQGGGGVPFLVYRNDGASSIPVNDPQVNIDTSFDLLKYPAPRGMNNKFSMLSGYEYTVVFRTNDVVNDFRKLDPLIHVQVSSETLGEVSPVIRMAGLGAQCRLVGGPATALDGVDQLRNFNGSGYYSSEGDFYFRLKTNAAHDMTTGATLSQQSVSKQYWVSCDKPPQPKVIGMYEITTTNDNKVFAAGWACDQTVNQSIDLHFYVANGNGSQEIIGWTTANIASENQVLAACANYKGAYRFYYELNAEQVSKHAGKTFIAYGLSKSGGVNNAISNMGALSLIPTKNAPADPPAQPPQTPPIAQPQPAPVVPAPVPVVSPPQQPPPVAQPQPVPAPVIPLPTPVVSNNEVVGFIDGISSDRVINGWLCNKGIARSINYHIYAAVPGQAAQTFVASGFANEPSEDAVAKRCEVGSGSYRFSIRLPVEAAGKAIYVYGISISGDNKNNPLERSGDLVAPSAPVVAIPVPATAVPDRGTPTATPSPPPAPAPAPVVSNNEVVGFIDGISSDRVINGWLCNKGIARSINYHIYAAIPGQAAQTFVAGGFANEPSEDAVAKRCEVGSGSYRFSIRLPAEAAGKMIYVYGISISGDNKNNPLERSGELKTP